jgi:hypothetical protein
MRHAIPVIGAFAIALAATTSAGLQQWPPGDDDLLTVEFSSELVPFSAAVTNVFTSDVSHGTFHRRGDGSVAWHFVSPVVAITIHNAQTRRTYAKLGDDGWTASELDPSVLRPPAPALRLPRRDVQLIVDPVLGDVYEHRNPRTGDIVRIAVALNGFLVGMFSPGGISQEFSDFRLGEQADSLFEPPAGVAVRETGLRLYRRR